MDDRRKGQRPSGHRNYFVKVPRLGPAKRRLSESAHIRTAAVHPVSRRTFLASWLPVFVVGAAKDTRGPGTAAPSSGSVTAHALGLRNLPFRAAGLKLFRSSTFYNPRTRGGYELYRTFGDHYAARVYGGFARIALRSHDLASFRRQLEAYRNWAEEMAKIHHTLMICINVMPSWLSTSRDRTPIQGWHTAAGTHGPRDYGLWRELVSALAEFYRRFDVQMYYEVWNEPDVFSWREGVDEYLRLYAETAKAVKSAAPRARVGGAAVNRWNAALRGDPRRTPLELELIRYAAEHDLPLDFLSWHHFSRNTEEIHKASKTFRAAARGAGLSPLPELVVSEWNVDRAGRNSPVHAALMAGLFAAFYEAGVDLHMVAAWEDFHPVPDPEGYGLVRQDGTLKPVYHLHRALDRMAKEASGVAVERRKGPNTLEGDFCMVVFRQGGGRYGIAAFEIGLDGPTAAALQCLLDRGLTMTELKAYGSTDKLREAILAGTPRDPGRTAAFRAARTAFEVHPSRSAERKLAFTGADRIQVLSATRIKGEVRPARVRAEGNRLSFDLEKNEVLLMNLHVQECDPAEG